MKRIKPAIHGISTSVVRTIAPNIVQQGANTGIPFKSDALFWLDGTISGNTFVDKSGNNRNFTITGKDFDTTWVKGFPYKSNATISAPAGDSALIAADVNGFLYTAGTPNQIPVISLFQDINYANKMFCRHGSQIFDANSVELLQPRVLDIVLYNTVKTSTNLTACQSYYSVPAEDAAGKWVDFVNGNNTTGDGSKAAPWKTFNKAAITLSSGATIYYKNGANITHSLNYNDDNTKSFKIISTGYCIINTGTAYASKLVLGGNEIHGFIFQTGTASTGIYCSMTSGNLTINRCKIGNFTNGSLLVTAGSSGSVIELKNSIVSGLIVYKLGDLTVENCIINGQLFNTFSSTYAANTNQLTVRHNKFVMPTGAAGWVIDNTLNKLVIFDNDINATSHRGLFTNADSTISKVEIEYNKYVGYTGVSTSYYFINAKFTKCNYNKVYLDSSSYGIKEPDLTFTDVEIKGNLFDMKNRMSIAITGACSGLQNLTVSGNTFLQRSVVDNNESTCLQIGTTDSTIRTFNLIVEKNRFKGAGDFTGTILGHSLIFVANVKKLICKYNKFSGSGLYSVVFKSNQTTIDNTGSLINYNLFDGVGICLKTIHTCKIYGNTLNYKNNIVIDVQSAGWLCSDIDIKNNISRSVEVDGYVITKHIGAHTFTSDYNVFYNPNLAAKYYLNGVAKTFAEWKASGYDANSVEQNPNLDSGLIPSSSIAVTDLGTSYNQGLDVSSDFGSTTTVPVVVLKQQQTWQAGAYLK